MKATITPAKLNGAVSAPPSKSDAHRKLLCAAFTNGKTKLQNMGESDDIAATTACIQTLQEAQQAKKAPVFACQDSASTLRFLIPISLVLCGGGTFTGSERLIKRGIAGYEELFAAQGIAVQKEEHAFHITGSLPAGNYVLRADESSQYATGMLFALSLLEKDSTLTLLSPVESRGYVELTMDVMRQYGVIVTEKEPNVFFIAGGQHYQAATYAIEGDWSNAAVLFAYNAFGSTLQIQGLSRASKQADRNCEELIHQVVHKTAQTKPLDLSQNPDLAPLLFAAAAAAKGGHFVGIQRLRNKESNRVAAMCEELAKFGIACKEGENEIIIEQAALQRPQEVLNGHNDHRIVMALTFLASLVGGSIEGAQAVNKSWREFFPTLQTLGLRVQWEEITNKK